MRQHAESTQRAQGALREHSESTQRALGERSQGTVREYSENTQKALREPESMHSESNQRVHIEMHHHQIHTK